MNTVRGQVGLRICRHYNLHRMETATGSDLWEGNRCNLDPCLDFELVVHFVEHMTRSQLANNIVCYSGLHYTGNV